MVTDLCPAHQLNLTPWRTPRQPRGRDLERFFEKLVPEDADYEHDDEGPDDSTSHIRMAVDRNQQRRFRLSTEKWNSERGRAFFYSNIDGRGIIDVFT